MRPWLRAVQVRVRSNEGDAVSFLRAPAQGGIIEFEAPIDVSNVMLVCPQTGEPTRIGIRRDEDGQAIRYSKKSGEDID